MLYFIHYLIVANAFQGVLEIGPDTDFPNKLDKIVAAYVVLLRYST